MAVKSSAARAVLTLFYTDEATAKGPLGFGMSFTRNDFERMFAAVAGHFYRVGKGILFREPRHRLV
jgi:hypothetical protein